MVLVVVALVMLKTSLLIQMSAKPPWNSAFEALLDVVEGLRATSETLPAASEALPTGLEAISITSTNDYLLL